MQLLYKVIKNNSVIDNGAKEIKTNAEQTVIKAAPQGASRGSIDSYENLARSILENARIQKEQIMSKAYEEVRKIEDEALLKAEEIKRQGYEEAFKEGQEAGFNKGLQQAENEKERAAASAVDMMVSARKQFEKYFEEKQKEIFDTIVSISEKVIKREITDKAFIADMIYDALEASKNSKNFIIRCNEAHVEELNSETINWKEKLGFKGDIFIVKDNNVQIGNAFIDKGNGRLEVGINVALHRVRELMEGKE